MNRYSFTYIIGYKHTTDRLNNLKRVLDWINGFVGVEVLLIEQDKHSKISHLGLKAKHIFLKTDKPYNKSWAFNYATKISNSNIIVFADSDLIMNPNSFIDGLKMLEQHEMISPYKSVIDLNGQESTLPIENIISIDRPGRGETDHQKVPLCGGICMFRKESIIKIGGWPEEYSGWGGEDDFLTKKVQSFLSWNELDNKCYHLYHTRHIDQNQYQKTLQMLQQMQSWDKTQLTRYIGQVSPKIGMKNKYDTF
jgi:hypothetical protein